MQSSSTLENPLLAPTFLNAETKGIWNGWNLIGNKEVTREAATKGTHIQLALLFLKSRKKLDEVDTLKWFHREILEWVSELLQRQQIFKASHILTNINLDPTEEITNIFINSTDNDLRTYLGSYLVKIDKICEDLKENWLLLNKMIENGDLCKNDTEHYLNIASIQTMQLKDKQEIAANLFVKTLDDNLIFFLQPFPLWKSFLDTDNINFILSWINRLYSKDYNNMLSKSINNLFSTFSINANMINAVQESEISHINKTLILNELCKYGIFNDTERIQVTDLVKRLCDIRELTHINNILMNSSVIDINQFYRLLVIYCLENKFYGLLGFCTANFNNLEDTQQEVKSKYFDIIIEFKNMFNNLYNIEIMRKNIYSVAQMITKHVGTYFEENPLILLALIILTKDVDLFKVFDSKNAIAIGNYNISTNVVLNNYAIINNIISRMSISFYKSDISQYDLIETSHEIDLTDVLKFRFNDDVAFPNFNCPILVQKYGYNKRIKYLTYVKYGRPILATNFFNVNLLPYSKSKIQKLAFRNFFNPLVVSSCIIFTELIGSNTEYLRCHISAAKIILDNELEVLEELILLLENISECTSNFLLLLETAVMKQIDININSTGTEVINAIKYYSIVVQFTILHNLPLPVKFLKYCARNNLWLPYLMHLQKYNYPIEIAQRAIQCCGNETLLEHLQHCLLYDIQVEKKKTPRSRDSRSFYLSRIGMRKNVKEDPQSTSADGLLQSSVTSQSSYGSATSSSGLSDFIESDTLDLKTSLLQTIIKCHNSTDPPRALLQACQYYNYPLFAILATSYEPDSVIKNWLTWLTVSCGIHKQFVIYDKVTASASLVTEILQTTIKNGYCKTLEQSLQIFLADNPLNIFARFLSECLKLHFDESILKECSNKFKSTLKFKRSNSIISENDHEMTYLNNKLWLEQTAIILLATMLQFNYKSKYEKIKLLQFLNVINFKEYFIGNVPDFFKLLQIANILIKTTVDLNFSTIYDQNCYRKELASILENLVDNKYFNEALEIAKIENYERDKILIKRLKYEQESNGNLTFWEYCNVEFIIHNISATDVVEFYTHFYLKSVHCKEQITILKLAQEWASNSNLDNLYDIEKNFWILYFKELELSKNFNPNTTYTYLTYKDMMAKLNSYEKVFIKSENKLSHEQCEVAISELLNAGDIFQALRFQRMFEYKNTDLEIIKLCMSVAEGLVLPYQLSAEQRLLIAKGHNTMSLNHRRRTFLSTRLSSMSSSSYNSPYSCNQRFSPLAEPLALNTSVQDAIIILECLVDRLKAGLDFAQRVLMLYRISANIDTDYTSLIDIKDSENSFALLRTVLAEDCRNKLEVVHDCVQVYKWTREEVSDFLCEEIITSLNAQVKLKTDIYLLWDLQIDNDFQMILQLLLDNCTLVGHKLYSYASAVHHSEIATSAIMRQEEFSLVIELLIRAHDCYTADCNMEGISVILKKCRALIGYLLTKECWKLIVRLLTGVGRYTEMNYVFQILREHDQFEFLLRKGSRKDNGLKLALLEYLKKYCPENRELYRMVALHFTLFSEVAELWENEADGIIRNLIAISKLEMQNQRINPDTEPFVLFTNTDGTKLCLKKAMVNYTHAAEYHLQGEKLSKAMKSAKQAELLALQLSLLKSLPTNTTTTCLLHLTRDQINRLLHLELNFPQAIILIEAYNHNVDWATVLFKQFIMDNKQTYFDSFLRTIPLSDALVHNLSRRYLFDRTLPDTATINMQCILRNVTSVRIKYKIASELVFTDILEELLASDQLAYLKDTVWKRGYKE